MDVDVVHLCGERECDCGSVLQKLEHIKQGQYGMCWFVSMLNALLLSEKLNKALRPFLKDTGIQLCKLPSPKNVAAHLDNDVSGQSCLPNRVTFENISMLYQHVVQARIFAEILQEFVSHEVDICRFGCDNTVSGGIPYKVIVPYLVRLGFPVCDIKHVIMSFENISKIMPGVNPRSLKFGRLFVDYLQALIADEKVCPRIFIVSQLIYDLDKPRENIEMRDLNWNTGRYICFLVTERSMTYLITYSLDCGFLLSNNNGGRYMNAGHAICMVTCQNKGFIVNSYSPRDEDDHDHDVMKSCSVYKYDWHKWKKDDFFFHSIVNDNECGKGSIVVHVPDFDDNFLQTGTNEFLFHRNVGNNTLVYVREESALVDLTKTTSLDQMHQVAGYEFNTLYEIYIKPYFVLLNVMTNYAFENKITYITYVDSLKCTRTCRSPRPILVLKTGPFDPSFEYRIIQEGVIEDGMQVAVYSVTNPRKGIPDVGELLCNCLPDDVMVLQNVMYPNRYYILVQYIRGPRLPEDAKMRDVTMANVNVTPHKKETLYGGKAASRKSHGRRTK